MTEQQLEMTALRTATDLRMTHRTGEEAFIANRDRCREAQQNGDDVAARMRARAGRILVELGALSEERAMELLDPAVEVETGPTVELKTDFRKITKNHGTSRYRIDRPYLLVDGHVAMAAATDGKILAVDDHVAGNCPEDGVYSIDRADLPTARKDRSVTTNVAFKGETDFPGIGKFVMRDVEDHGSSITVNATLLRNLLDAIVPHGEKDVEVTLHLNRDCPDTRPMMAVTDQGIGVIMPVKSDRDPAETQKRIDLIRSVSENAQKA
ncbi:MAG: hypothetical protein VX951_08910 [Planctomycetota bacterium]|nr:hypothetical protein [Planctomycetota bacterium]